MTREQKIKEAARQRADQYSHPSEWSDTYYGFIDGAKWADKHPQWIPVEEELPAKRKDPLVISDKVFIHTTGGHYLSAVYDYQDKEWIDEYNIETLAESDEVTHWMPIASVTTKKGEQGMKILELNEMTHLLPEDVDCECVSICNTLNRLPGLITYESCSGHGKRPFCVWFRCDNIDTLSRLGRVVDKRYSDGNWEIVLDSCDGNPRGCFWLRTKSILSNDELCNSLANLEENILYWFQDEFDRYFNEE